MRFMGENSLRLSIDHRKQGFRIRRGKLTHFVVFVVALFTALPILANGSDSKKVRCGEQSLKRAIDKARPGSTIVVIGSCSDGPYLIEKDLRLVGGKDAELLTHLQVDGATVRVENLKIIGDGMGVGRGGRLIADQVEIRDAFIGIGVLDLSILEIRNSLIANSSNLGIWAVGRAMLLVDSTRIENSGVGIYLESTSSARVYSTTIRNGIGGIDIGRFSEVETFNVTIEDNEGTGILLSDKYSYIFMEDQSIIQNNGLDLRCGDRAIVEVVETNVSATGTTEIDPGCTLLGNPIF
ncbi:MAG TPA: right-handed parallel beta-helix repeat-containing protein [Vicinamibacteria bacterium]|nr:right-handed parallel beta-helix repeat-containing protein [Vicinamibacteria bacterium]